MVFELLSVQSKDSLDAKKTIVGLSFKDGSVKASLFPLFLFGWASILPLQRMRAVHLHLEHAIQNMSLGQKIWWQSFFIK